MKHLRHLAASTAVAAALVSLTVSQVSADTLIRWTDGSAERGTRAASYHWFADTIKEKSGGEIDFQFYWGGALMGHAANVEGVGGGAADMAQIIAAYNPKELQPYAVGDMPLVDADPWVGMMAMYELVTTEPVLQKMFDDLNLVYIGNQTTAGVQLVCKGIDAKGLDDLKGVKIRASSLYGKVLSELGANVISLSQEDVYSALDTGLVSCNQQYTQGVIPYRQNEVSDQLLRLDWGQYLGFGVIMNKDTFESLSPEHQELVRQTGREFMDVYAEKMMENIATAEATLDAEDAEHRVKITTFPEADMKKLAELSQIEIDNWITTTTEAGFPAQELYDKFLALTAKYQAELDAKGYPWERN